MISDTLLDAIRTIEHYQNRMPTIYEPLKTEIDKVKNSMHNAAMNIILGDKRLDSELPKEIKQ